jgi:menaquinol-cytochrome c reductase iron-sulfur subunit
MRDEKDPPDAPGIATPSGGERLEHREAPPATPHEIARRQLLGRMSIGLGVVCGAAISAPGIGFVVAPIFRDSPREWRAVGRVDQFKVGETVNVVFTDASPLPWAGVTAKTSAWLRRVAEGEFVAFSVNCAHLGCPVRWLDKARLFMCPCHGGVYYEDGRVAAGPPPHPLTRYPVRINDEQVEIRTEPIPIG